MDEYENLSCSRHFSLPVCAVLEQRIVWTENLIVFWSSKGKSLPPRSLAR
jgi:hypothetical protein